MLSRYHDKGELTTQSSRISHNHTIITSTARNSGIIQITKTMLLTLTQDEVKVTICANKVTIDNTAVGENNSYAVTQQCAKLSSGFFGLFWQSGKR